MALSTTSSQSAEVKEIEKEKPTASVEPVHTIERVPGQSHYYEKDGLRTYGDDEDHDHEPKVSTLSAISKEICAWPVSGFFTRIVTPIV